MKFALAVDTRVGGRPYNEDRIGVVYSEHAVMLVLADGMGGHAHGEVAAQIAVDVFSELFKNACKPQLQHPRRFLLNAGHEAHQAILDHAIRHRMSEVPSTTLVAAILQQHATVSITVWAPSATRISCWATYVPSVAATPCCCALTAFGARCGTRRWHVPLLAACPAWWSPHC